VANGWAHCVQVALFDRIHSIRVKAIQEEYQRYMERVRTKAQNAIDQANTQYQHSRTMLTAHVDTLVHYLQNRHLQVCTAPAPAGEWHALAASCHC
jgi:DNA-directed RNA polymerase subunit N (RpoN/RPB10)